VKTTIIVCPFANFGSPGAAQGAELLADALRELLDDVKKEKRPTRSRAFRGQVHIEEMKFDAMESIAAWRKSARSLARSVLDRDEFLIWMGGNHLSVLPVYEELAARDVRVVQFDAHLDLYNLDDCKTELNHGNFLRHAEKLPPIVNFGHRDLFLQSKAIGEFYEAAYSAADLARAPDASQTALREWAADAEHIFLDIDCDVLDPTFFPATTHPMPFGLAPESLLRWLDAVWSERVCGVALSEFNPARDRDDRSLQTLVWLLEWILLKKYE
jgi:arginase family enzyme